MSLPPHTTEVGGPAKPKQDQRETAMPQRRFGLHAHTDLGGGVSERNAVVLFLTQDPMGKGALSTVGGNSGYDGGNELSPWSTAKTKGHSTSNPAAREGPASKIIIFTVISE